MTWIISIWCEGIFMCSPAFKRIASVFHIVELFTVNTCVNNLYSHYLRHYLPTLTVDNIITVLLLLNQTPPK